MRYRDAAAADLPAIDRLYRASFVATFGHLYAPEDLASFLAGFTPAGWQAELDDPAYAFRLAEHDGAVVGFAKLGPPSFPAERQGPAIELRQLYLAEEAKGTGAAAALMEWVLATARARGAGELWLSVYVDNHRARRFYARYGFADMGRYIFMVGNHPDEDRLMRLTL